MVEEVEKLSSGERKTPVELEDLSSSELASDVELPFANLRNVKKVIDCFGNSFDLIECDFDI